MKCAVITPVGPGHMDLYERECRASIEVAIQNGMGVFEDVKPFMMDDTLAQMGRSKARNITLDLAAGEGYDWVFFLDADDIMAPDAFVAFSKEYEANPSVDCFWGAIAELTASGPVAREGQIESILSTAHFLGSNPFLSIQIGFFGKLDVVRRFGFDVTMDAGEDFKLYYQLWNASSCIKTKSTYFYNRRGLHSTGQRSATGRDWSESLQQQWSEQCASKTALAYVNSGKYGPLTFAINDPMEWAQNAHSEGKLRYEDVVSAALKHVEKKSIDVSSAFTNGEASEDILVLKAIIPDLDVTVSQECEGSATERSLALNGYQFSQSEAGEAVECDYAHLDVDENIDALLEQAGFPGLVWAEMPYDQSQNFIKVWIRKSKYRLVSASKNNGQKVAFFLARKK